jgi:hypothetical protein
MILALKTGVNLIKVETQEEFKLNPDDTIWWNPEQEKIHIFDSATTLSLI